MKRTEIKPRKNWQSACEKLGFDFHTMYGAVYWDESVQYEFTMNQVIELERATNEVFSLCMETMERVIRRGNFAAYHVPNEFWRSIVDSWDKDDPTLYGRFDFSWDGVRPPKLLEFNADTPTSLLETSIVQWHWLLDVHGKKTDQFNSIHEKLLAQWKYVKDRTGMTKVALSSLHDDGDSQLITEDFGNVAYLAETAREAGLDPRIVFIEDYEWDQSRKMFVDGDGEALSMFFKLYPWEWMVREEYAPHLITTRDQGAVIMEPMWKMLLSNKYFLVDLWNDHRGHPNLLHTSVRSGDISGQYVSKPLYSREGANVTIFDDYGHEIVSQGGSYGQEGFIYQQAALLPKFTDTRSGDVYPMIGSWIIGGEAAGMGIRESSSLITENMSRFVPHLIM